MQLTVLSSYSTSAPGIPASPSATEPSRRCKNVSRRIIRMHHVAASVSTTSTLHDVASVSGRRQNPLHRERVLRRRECVPQRREYGMPYVAKLYNDISIKLRVSWFKIRVI